MKLPAEAKTILAAFVAAFPIPDGDRGEAFEETIRQWTMRFVQTVLARTADASWGSKRADAGRPIGKDSIARQVDGHLWGWDLLLGAGTGRPTLHPDPDGEDITGQVFEPVEARDWLASPEPQPEPEPQPDGLLARLEAIERQLAALYAVQTGQLDVLREIVSTPPPQYRGSVRIAPFGSAPITLDPFAPRSNA
jgi:hypothetical protein